MNNTDIIDGYRAVVEQLGVIHRDKLLEYGISRYAEADNQEAPVMLFSDIHRKYIRLRQQLLYNVIDGEAVNWDSVRSGCQDLANYGIMGVQIADLIQSKGRQPQSWAEPLPKGMASDPGPAEFPIEQIAIMGDGHLISALHMLGVNEWHHDEVTTRAFVSGHKGPVQQEAHLAFNYQMIPGKELEIIKYKSGENWLAMQGVESGLSHLGLHVNSIEQATVSLRECLGGDVDIVQDAVTIKHTNPNIKDTRRYRYRIFGTRALFGFDLKFIQRYMLVEGARYIVYEEPFGKIAI